MVYFMVVAVLGYYNPMWERAEQILNLHNSRVNGGNGEI